MLNVVMFTEAYLEPSQTSLDDEAFLQKCFLVDVFLASKCASSS